MCATREKLPTTTAAAGGAAMDGQTRYLDELVGALRAERAQGRAGGYAGEFPPREGGGRARRVARTVVAKLADAEVADAAFWRACEALDLVFTGRPMVLAEALDEEAGVLWAVRSCWRVAAVHFGRRERGWALRRASSRWVRLCADLYGQRWRARVGAELDRELCAGEAAVRAVLGGGQEAGEHMRALRALCVAAEWAVSREFWFVTGGAERVGLRLQRLARLARYIGDAVELPLAEYEEVQVRLLGVSVQAYLEPDRPGLGELRFALEQLQYFVRGKHLRREFAAWSRLLLRLYVRCRSDRAALLLVREVLVLDAAELPEAATDAQRSLQLVRYDLERQFAADHALRWDPALRAKLLAAGTPPVILEPFTSNRQLEKLRLRVLCDFQVGDSALLVHQFSAAGVPLGADPVALYTHLDEGIARAFGRQDTEAQVRYLSLVRKLACLESRKPSPGFDCDLCDHTNLWLPRESIDPSRPEAASDSLAFKLLVGYYLREQLESSGEALVIGILITLRSIFTHFQPPKLVENHYGDMVDEHGCIQLFRMAFMSLNRHVRILSVLLIPYWNLSRSYNADEQQTALIIKFLQRNPDPHITETYLMAWTQLTLSTSGELFDSLLLKLIDIFNSSNFVEHVVMASQLKFIARVLNKTAYQLLSPILPILLKQIGKNLGEKKLSLERLLNLLEYSAKTVIENFQRYIVPYALTQYKGDALTEIAKIMCQNNEPSMVSEQKKRLLDRNSRQIFAVALVKHGLFSLETIETLFINNDPTFDRSYVAGFLPDYKTLAEVLKLFKPVEKVDSPMNDNERAVLSSLRFLFLTNFSVDKHRGSKFKNVTEWTQEKEAVFQKKLKDNILGIFQVFSSDMHDIEGKTTYFEKLRVISGISFLIKYASKECIISALAQVSICLQTGLEIPEMRYNTLRCWLHLVKYLSEEELSTVIDVLICFILQKWDEFSGKIQQAAIDILDALILEKQTLLTNSRPYIVLAFLNKSELHIFENHGFFARTASKLLKNTNWVSVFVSNLKSHNIYVIKQTLQDIRLFLEKKQDAGIDIKLISKDGKNISELLGALLDTSHKYRNSDLIICETCALCISMIGVLDVTKHELQRCNVYDNDICDFNNPTQTTKFLINIINERLVPSFWQSENPTKQLFVALVIQESLKYCGLSASSWDVTKPDLYPNESKLWNRFNDISKTTLYPLLSSLYLAQSWKEYVPLSYPSFKVKDGYSTWIKNLSLDLLKTATESSHPLHVFSSLIREDDGTLSDYLLPYIIMDIIIKAESGTKYFDYLQNVIKDFEYIFNYTLYDLNHYQIDGLKMCYDSIFRVFEYCKKWVNQFRQNYSKQHGTFTIREEKYTRMLNRAGKFADIIPSHVLAQKSLETNSFERSALYLEQSYREKSSNGLQDDKLLPYLQTTYAEINDIDAVVGVLKVFCSNNLTSRIEELQYSDNWKMAQDCFDALGDSLLNEQGGVENSVPTSRMLKLMYDHQLYDQTLKKLELNIPSKKRQLPLNLDEFYNMGIETASLSGNITELKIWIRRIEQLETLTDPSILLHYNLAKSLLAVLEGKTDMIETHSKYCYRLIGSHFTTPSHSTTLLKRRNLFIKLHGIRDNSILSKCSTDIQFNRSVRNLAVRFKNVGSDFEPNFYLLSMRKSHNLMRSEEFVKQDLADTYFKMAQLARENDRLDIASDCLMHALKLEHTEAELEYAEILWKQGEKELALKTVAEIHQKRKGIKTLKDRDRAKVLLKYTEWLDLSNNATSVQISHQYKEVIGLDKDWDEPYYSFGLYYSRLLEKKRADGFVTTGSLEYKAITYFLSAFEKNTVKVREALPKVITFWLDTASRSVESGSSEGEYHFKRYTKEICKCIDVAIQNCPTHIWYTVLTQLLSRLLHKHTDSATLIMNILLKLTLEYPSIMLWYITVLLNSQENKRVHAGKQIMDAIKKRMPDKSSLISSAISLVQAMTRVCIKDVKNMSSRSGKSLQNDFKFDINLAPSEMVVPVNINLANLSPSYADTSGKHGSSKRVTINCFTPHYKVYSSLKKPKKINIIGSDGELYGIMCKKEDVRQDNQYMQFANMMVFLLGKDSESRRRSLNITTYAILSLREDCGLIEIVPNVDTIRSILMAKYDSMKIKYTLSVLYEKWKSVSEEQRLGFYKSCTDTFPPVLYQWFLETFPNPIRWYNARNAFVRSYAVMAMVGHILGLGDRHLENILLDLQTGKVLHVDFDCLFEKGKTLPVPEIVPFRLTQNIQDAFGVTGTEGTFKKSSEVTVRVMRNNELALVNIIETIMYDRNMDHSIQNALRVLRNKVRGIDPRDDLPLSVPGQVDTVVQQASSDENLAQMYIGWLPFW